MKEHQIDITIRIKDNKIIAGRTHTYIGQSVWKKIKFERGSRQQIVFPFNTTKGWMELNAELRYR